MGFFQFQGSRAGLFSTLPPVTSKKSIVFLGMMKIAGFFKVSKYHAGLTLSEISL
jgi:hypothetical protein